MSSGSHKILTAHHHIILTRHSRIPPKTPFYWSYPGHSEILVKFTHTSSTIYRQPEYVAKALENAYFETLYDLGPQGGGAATNLERPLDWPGAPAGEAQSTDLKVTPGPRLTWSIWSHVLAGLYSFSLRYEGFDFDAEVEWKNAPGISLGDVSFVSRGSR